MFVEALLLQASEILGVGTLNALAAGYGYPFAGALVLSGAGFMGAIAVLSFGRPGCALSLATTALAHGMSFDVSVALARVAAAVLAVALVSAVLRKALRLSCETAPAGR